MPRFSHECSEIQKQEMNLHDPSSVVCFMSENSYAEQIITVITRICNYCNFEPHGKFPTQHDKFPTKLQLQLRCSCISSWLEESQWTSMNLRMSRLSKAMNW